MLWVESGGCLLQWAEESGIMGKSFRAGHPPGWECGRVRAKNLISGCCAGVARLLWEQEVARSNRVTRTNRAENRLFRRFSAHFYSCFRCGDPLRFSGCGKKITGGRQGLPRTRTTTIAPFRANMFSYRSNSPNACPGTPASIFALRKLQVLYACPACFPFLCGKCPMCVIHKFVDYFL